MLYVTNRTKPTHKIACHFLCARVKAPTEQDKRKLVKLLSNLWQTQEKKFLFGRGDEGNALRYYVDGAFIVHSDGKSRGGLVVEYGGSIINCGSSNHKICTKDSTASEGVSVSDYIPKMEWLGDFLTGQGRKIMSTALLQDNMYCMMILEDPSIGKLCTQHLRARFGEVHKFLIVRGGAEIQHLKADLMVADTMTKSLLWVSLRHFEDTILNHITWEEMV